MGTIGEVARLVKPADCQCGYPRVVARNMNGHDSTCPVYQRWLAARALHDLPPPEPRPITLRREEVPEDEPRPDEPPPRREEQPDDTCLGKMPRKVTGDPRRRHESDPRRQRPQ